jgi:two-component system, OmpR family, phosphate regulon response regulator PhoB
MTVNSKKILVVEDQPDMKIFIANILRADGYNCIFAESSDQALKKVTAFRPDLIIIDMMIPRKQGILFYRGLKSLHNLAGWPVIMLCSIEKKTFFQCHKIQEPGAGQSVPLPEAYLEMPPEAEALLNSVAEIISKKQKIITETTHQMES